MKKKNELRQQQCQRSFIDVFVKRVHSGQITGSELCTKVSLCCSFLLNH